MFKLKLLVMLTFVFSIISSCSSTKDNSKRDIAASGSGNGGVSEQDYYNHRGQKKRINWSYDGYEAQKYLFGKAIVKPSNVKFLKTGTSLRQNLFENNLKDTGVDDDRSTDCDKVMYIKRRSPTGNCYFHGLVDKMSAKDKDLAMQVLMGAKGQRFGRNTNQGEANHASQKDIMTPNPFKVSQKLFNRKDGKTRKAEVINLLAAAWLQSMNHDWFSHGKE